MTYPEALAYLTRDPHSVEAEAAEAIKTEMKRMQARFDAVTVFCGDALDRVRIDVARMAERTSVALIEFDEKCRSQ